MNRNQRTSKTVKHHIKNTELPEFRVFEFPLSTMKEGATEDQDRRMVLGVGRSHTRGRALHAARPHPLLPPRSAPGSDARQPERAAVIPRLPISRQRDNKQTNKHLKDGGSDQGARDHKIRTDWEKGVQPKNGS